MDSEVWDKICDGFAKKFLKEEKIMPNWWYEHNKCLREKDIVGYREFDIQKTHGRDGKVRFMFVDGEGKAIGRLDPNREWSRKMILRAENARLEASGEATGTKDDDTGLDRGKSPKWDERGAS